MGMIKKSCMLYSDSNISASAPDPKSFVIRDALQVGKHVIVSIYYPDCDNFEGNKILVFVNTTIKVIKDMKEIDPHFSKDLMSPFARFAPTEVGKVVAVLFAQQLNFLGV